jgi:phenylacetate-CoA ligase
MASIIKYIKKKPSFIQKAFFRAVPFSARYGSKFREHLKFLSNAEKWSYDQTKEWQLYKLRTVLKDAQANVPYYRNLFQQYGFDPNIKSLEDIKVLPVLTKDIIKENQELIVNENFTGKKYKMSTSGTSGKRIDVFGCDDLYKIEAAYIFNACKSHGIELYDKHSIWLRRYSPSEGQGFCLHDYELNRSYASAFHLNDSTIMEYIDFMDSMKSETLVSYPSTIHYLALLCEKHNVRPKFIKYLHGASEMCFPNWRSKIREVLGIDIKMHYGQVEKVSFSYQDSEDSRYNESLTYGYNEFLDDGTIVATGFWNQVMPLIRYRTEDRVETDMEYSPKGSHPKTIKEILGRNGDMLLTDVGSLVPAVNFYSFMSRYGDVDFFQIIQHRDSLNIDFMLMVNSAYSNETESRLLQEFSDRLGKVKVNFIYTKNIERDQVSNKLKTVRLI